MYQQIILDKPPVRVFNVPTLNKEARMKTEPSNEDLAKLVKQRLDNETEREWMLDALMAELSMNDLDGLQERLP